MANDLAPELMAFRGFSQLSEPQRLAFERGVDGNLVVSANTASGKTFIAEVAAVGAIRKGKKAVYLVPLRALASEKFEYFSQLEGVKVEMRTGDYDSSEEDLSDTDFIIATYQKFDSMVRHSPQWLKDVGLVVADEGHEITDQENGSTIEVLLTRLKETSVKVLVLSAVMPNVEEVAAWLGAGVVKSDWRPVPLSKGVYSKERSEVLHKCGLTSTSRSSRDRLYPSCRKYGCARYGGGVIEFVDGTKKKVTGVTDSPVCDLALDTVKQGGQALIFARSRRESVGFAQKIGPHLVASLNPNELKALAEVAEKVRKVGPDYETSQRLASCIRTGSAFHNAGMARELRAAVEESFRSHLVKAISSTPTLAAGINTPARRVIVQSVSRWTPSGWDEIPRWEAENMLGRAGRPGYDTYGEAILVGTERVSANELLSYLARPLEDIDSKLIYKPSFYSHVLSEICLSQSASERDITGLFSKTFYAAQEGGEESVRGHVKEVLGFLVRHLLVKSNRDGVGFEPTSIGERLSKLYVTPLSYPLIRSGLERRQTILGYLQLATSMIDWNCRPPRIEEEGYNGFYHEDGTAGLVVQESEEVTIREGSLNSAFVLMDWIEEKPEPFYKKYGLGDGDFYTMKETADWLLFAAREVARLEGRQEAVKDLDVLSRRMRKGVKEELLDICSVKGVGRVTGRRLFNQGVRTAAEYRAPKEGTDRLDAYT